MTGPAESLMARETTGMLWKDKTMRIPLLMLYDLIPRPG
jgi:hypothetical protein